MKIVQKSTSFIFLLGDEMRDLEMVPDSMLHSSADRPAFIDRLANSITKRKRSTPQKFVGKAFRLDSHRW